MTTIENAIGKRIQITNSPIYCQLNKKVDLQFGMNYESLLMSISNLAHTLGRYVDADISKIELYTSILGLGKIDGGKAVFDYINSNISNDKDKIGELDVMLHNLKKIFPDFEERFSEADFAEFSQLFLQKSTVIEVKIIKLVYYLELLAQKLKKVGKLNDRSSTDFIFNEMQKVINNYQQTKRIEMNEDVYNAVKNAYNEPTVLSNIDVEKLKNTIQLYNDGNINKVDVIDFLNTYEIVKEKKTKVR